MDFKEKLEKAAMLAAYNYANPDSDEPCYDADFYEGFRAGAEWLMGQPLSERLTEDERKRIRGMYADLIPLKGHMAGIVGQMMLLDKIFGKEMFEQ